MTLAEGPANQHQPELLFRASISLPSAMQDPLKPSPMLQLDMACNIVKSKWIESSFHAQPIALSCSHTVASPDGLAGTVSNAKAWLL